MKTQKIFEFIGDTLRKPGEERQYKADKKKTARKAPRAWKRKTRKDRIGIPI